MSRPPEPYSRPMVMTCFAEDPLSDFIIIQTRQFVKADFLTPAECPMAEYLEGSTVSMAILSVPVLPRRSRSSASAYTSAPVTSTPLASHAGGLLSETKL